MHTGHCSLRAGSLWSCCPTLVLPVFLERLLATGYEVLLRLIFVCSPDGGWEDVIISILTSPSPWLAQHLTPASSRARILTRVSGLHLGFWFHSPQRVVSTHWPKLLHLFAQVCAWDSSTRSESVHVREARAWTAGDTRVDLGADGLASAGLCLPLTRSHGPLPLFLACSWATACSVGCQWFPWVCLESQSWIQIKKRGQW